MIQVNIHDAKTHLSRLLVRVSGGEEVIIAKSGHPLARLVPIKPPSEDRVGGIDRGLFSVPDDFDDELPELAEAFES